MLFCLSLQNHDLNFKQNLDSQFIQNRAALT